MIEDWFLSAEDTEERMPTIIASQALCW